MSAIQRFVHDRAIALARLASKLLPDRTPVTFVGRDATAELCASIAQTRPARVAIVTDEGLVEAGIVERVVGALQAVGLESSVYSGVKPDPTLAQVEEGLALVRESRCDAVLALGGGSPMDAAKVIAAAATHAGEPGSLEGRFQVKTPPLPLFAIPTTAGTGSEATIAAVISDPDTHRKGFYVDPKLLPGMAALDPTLMTGLPPHVTAATGMDALTHAVESVIAKTSTPATEAYARNAIQRIFPDLPRAYEDGSDLDARKSMALAAYYAGLAFTRTSVGYVHAIAHTFGAYYGTPHGLANAIALPRVLDFSLEEVAPRLARMADWAGLPGAEGSDRERAQAFVAAVRALSQRLGIPEKLGDLQVADVPGIARQALDEAHLNYPVPRYMELEDCERLLGTIVV